MVAFDLNTGQLLILSRSGNSGSFTIPSQFNALVKQNKIINENVDVNSTENLTTQEIELGENGNIEVSGSLEII